LQAGNRSEHTAAARQTLWPSPRTPPSPRSRLKKHQSPPTKTHIDHKRRILQLVQREPRPRHRRIRRDADEPQPVLDQILEALGVRRGLVAAAEQAEEERDGLRGRGLAEAGKVDADAEEDVGVGADARPEGLDQRGPLARELGDGCCVLCVVCCVLCVVCCVLCVVCCVLCVVCSVLCVVCCVLCVVCCVLCVVCSVLGACSAVQCSAVQCTALHCSVEAPLNLKLATRPPPTRNTKSRNRTCREKYTLGLPPQRYSRVCASAARMASARGTSMMSL